MNYNLLGPLEVLHGNVPIRVDAPKQRALLSLLLMHANEVVSSARLLNLLWAESPVTVMTASRDSRCQSCARRCTRSER